MTNKPKLEMLERNQIASQIAGLGITITRVIDDQDACRKLGSSLITVAAAFLNPFHMDELARLIADFNRRKLNEELAKRN
jgi:hypothetical protein